MKKILISGEYQANTGFSKVVENIAKILKEEYQVTILDYSKSHGFVYRIDDMLVTGKSNSEKRFGTDIIINLIENYDFLFIINDIWNIDEMLTDIRMSGKKLPKIVIYFPVDATNHFAYWYKNLDIVDSVVTYTHFAKKVVLDAISDKNTGFGNELHIEELKKKISIIPHGIDKKTLSIIPEKKELRRDLFKSKKYDNSYIILNANRNQPRKRLDITLRAFKNYLERASNKNSFLYLHSAICDSHIDTYMFAKRLGILDNVIFTQEYDKKNVKPSFSDKEMNLVYNACDVGINTSIGEGWGLCSFEHAYTGGVQIVPDHSACKEIFSNDESEILKIEGSVTQDYIMTKGYVPCFGSALWKMFNLSFDFYRKEKREKTINKFHNPQFHWDFQIATGWLLIFSGLSQK